jgi:hypothetical protein
MNWKPATKQITGLQTVRVAHPLKHEEGVLAYVSPLFFKRKDLNAINHPHDSYRIRSSKSS